MEEATEMTDAVLRISHADAGWGIIARKRVWAITNGRLPTVEDYHAALVQCLRDKAAEIDRRRLTDEEREAVEFFGKMAWPTQSQQIKARAATLRGLLERTK